MRICQENLLKTRAVRQERQWGTYLLCPESTQTTRRLSIIIFHAPHEEVRMKEFAKPEKREGN